MIPDDELAIAAEDEAETAQNRVRRRAVEELRKAAAAAAAKPAGDGSAKELHIRFRRSPVEVVAGAAGSGAAATAVMLEENVLSGAAGARRPKGTGRVEELKAQLVLRSVGCVTSRPRFSQFKFSPFHGEPAPCFNLSAAVSAPRLFLSPHAGTAASQCQASPSTKSRR